ncbi:MAG: lipid A biosynthesis acyltransferase, partial [Betaproteobacteria bacterium]|nr:lipid A biosynthesis acyltransferase [Betaproteobacteria bacterium]
MSTLFIAWMRFLSHWPLPALRVLGHALGLLLCLAVPSRRRIVQINLRLCFPQKSEAEIDHLARAHFVQFAQSLLDRAWLWHAPLHLVEQRLKWVGSDLAMAQLAQEG